MKVAALDLGTNTFLCLIAEGTAERGITKVSRDLMKVVRLGQDVDKTKAFHPEALKRARACLEEFSKVIQEEKVEQILAMATSAARDVKNGDELFKIGRDLNIPIQVIPGEDEARITYQGATAGRDDKEKNILVVDVGGGSTEFILGSGKKIIFGESLDIGGVRLTEKYVKQQPVPAVQSAAVEAHIKKELERVLPFLKKQPIDEVVAVAGTPTSIAAIEVNGFDENKVDGYFLSRDRLQFWVDEFAKTTVEEKKSKYQLGGRADIIYSGASILLFVLKALDKDGMTVSTKGVRYGVALEMLKASKNS